MCLLWTQSIPIFLTAEVPLQFLYTLSYIVATCCLLSFPAFIYWALCVRTVL